MRSRTGFLLDVDEAHDLREMLAGMSVPVFETCPNLTVVEVLAIEATGNTIWTQLVDREQTRKKIVRMYVSMISDALYRDGNLEAVSSLWKTLVVAEPQYGALFGPELSNDMIVVSIFDVY